MKEIPLRRKEIYTGLFGIVFFFGGFLVGELGLRIINEIRFGGGEILGEVEHVEKADSANSPQKGFFTDDAMLRRPYPNQRLGEVRINNHGFRGADIPKEKPGDVLRFAFLGSSTTYDAAVPEGKEWPAQTIHRFKERAGNCKIDFINAGLPGFSTPNMETYWREVVRRYEPDVVIALPGDMTPNLQKAAKLKGFQLQNTEKSWLARNSVLWALISKNAEVVRLQHAAFSDNGKFQPDKSALTEKFRTDFGSLIDSIVEDGVYLAVPTIASHVRRDMPAQKQLIAADSALFYLPFISIPTLIEMQDAYNNTLRAAVKQRPGVLLIDGDELIPADNRHFDDSRHFAPRGSAVMGKRIADALLSSAAFQSYARQQVTCDWSTNNEPK